MSRLTGINLRYTRTLPKYAIHIQSADLMFRLFSITDKFSGEIGIGSGTPILPPPYVPTNRRFALTDKEHLRDPDQFSLLGLDSEGVFTWPELLDFWTIVVLGEGRSGKTREFQQQVDLLRSDGKYAFFVPIERLQDEEFEDALEASDLATFQEWQEGSVDVGHFFLDAVDELKLRSGTLRRALRKLQSACGENLSRVKLFLSCRPADWNSELDEPTLNPFSQKHVATEQPSEPMVGEAAFRKIIEKGDADQGVVSEPAVEAKPEGVGTPTIVTLLPLSREEVRSFAQTYAPNHSETFCNLIETDNLWHLYRLPVEIIDALDAFAEQRQLGTLEEQLHHGIQRKLRETDPKKRDALSTQRAQDGVERVALAMYMLKRRSIRVANNEIADALDIGQVLTDWSNEDLRELVSKPVFDPSGIGAVRFHHRATQEYLAARRVLRLREGGMPIGDIFALLFSKVGGIDVIKPTIAPVTAWLAFWDPDVCREVLKRQPQLLFTQGLPSAFPMELRKEVLRRYVSKFAGREWCATNVGHTELRRVAHPELGPVIRELWDSAYTGFDSRELLLELIWLGRVSRCADLALQALLDADIGPEHQTFAAWGLLSAGSVSQKCELANAVLNLAVPERVIQKCISEMVPELISATEFAELIGSMEQGPDSVHGLNYAIYQTAKNGNLDQAALAHIRDSMVEAIWESRRETSNLYEAHSNKDHYQDGLIAFCEATIPQPDEDVAPWARALTVAFHFGERHTSVIAKEETKILFAAMDERTDLREAYFWACLDISDVFNPEDDDWQRAARVGTGLRRSLRFDNEDVEWLLSAASLDAPANRRSVAFYALAQRYDLKADLELQGNLRDCVADRPDLLDELEKMLNPRPREPEDWELEHQEREKEFAAKESQRVQYWMDWREEVLNGPDFLLAGDRRLGVMYDAHNVISQSQSELGRWGHWDGDVLLRCLSPEFLTRYREELSAFWRETDVQLKSERTPDERNRYPQSWLLALTAVKAEAERGGWADALTHGEAVRSARIACIELNGFADFIVALEKAHPSAVASVITDEAKAQVEQLSQGFDAPIFHDVRYSGTLQMKVALARSVATEIPNLIAIGANGANDALAYIVEIIDEAGTEAEKRVAVNTFQGALGKVGAEKEPQLIGHLALLDPELGCSALLDITTELETADSRAQATKCFSAVFKGWRARRSIDLGKIPDESRVELLRQLTLRAYQAIRLEDDVEHEGVYSPDERDHAQDARSFLFNSLLNQRRPEALAAVLDLAARPEFAHMSDRLHEVAYESAATISDVAITSLAQFQGMDHGGVFQPFDDASLLRAMQTRLDAFAHDHLTAQDSPIAALRILHQETEIRRYIAHWLRNSDRGAFTFTQEAVAYDENRTDIRFQPRLLDVYGTVELKRETWSVAELEAALRDQLVGRYLQNEQCRSGILLICQAKAKRWIHPSTRSRLNLQDVVEYLSALANEIMADEPGLYLSVMGIDYS